MNIKHCILRYFEDILRRLFPLPSSSHQYCVSKFPLQILEDELAPWNIENNFLLQDSNQLLLQFTTFLETAHCGNDRFLVASFYMFWSGNNWDLLQLCNSLTIWEFNIQDYSTGMTGSISQILLPEQYTPISGL